MFGCAVLLLRLPRPLEAPFHCCCLLWATVTYEEECNPTVALDCNTRLANLSTLSIDSLPVECSSTPSASALLLLCLLLPSHDKCPRNKLLALFTKVLFSTNVNRLSRQGVCIACVVLLFLLFLLFVLFAMHRKKALAPADDSDMATKVTVVLCIRRAVPLAPPSTYRSKCSLHTTSTFCK